MYVRQAALSRCVVITNRTGGQNAPPYHQRQAHARLVINTARIGDPRPTSSAPTPPEAPMILVIGFEHQSRRSRHRAPGFIVFIVLLVPSFDCSVFHKTTIMSCTGILPLSFEKALVGRGDVRVSPSRFHDRAPFISPVWHRLTFNVPSRVAAASRSSNATPSYSLNYSHRALRCFWIRPPFRSLPHTRFSLYFNACVRT
jgi:hypothetical protein